MEKLYERYVVRGNANALLLDIV